MSARRLLSLPIAIAALAAMLPRQSASQLAPIGLSEVRGQWLELVQPAPTGFADLAVGIPTNAPAARGAVRVYYGGEEGLSATASHYSRGA